ncbi:MAG: UDP-2,3-diacylglucosamine diphosphatase [bacterium]|nr:UDP-2,3-diacylglucosamine diphosphatase [bacterium]
MGAEPRANRDAATHAHDRADSPCAQREGGSLVINGDLFDFWYEWKTVIPKRFFRILRTLQEATESGTPVYLLAGNHDFRLRGFLEQEIGLRTIQDALTLQIARQSIFVFHGDGVLRSDYGYRLLKRILRNRLAQRLFCGCIQISACCLREVPLNRAAMPPKVTRPKTLTTLPSLNTNSITASKASSSDMHIVQCRLNTMAEPTSIWATGFTTTAMPCTTVRR